MPMTVGAYVGSRKTIEIYTRACPHRPPYCSMPHTKPVLAMGRVGFPCLQTNN